MRDSISHEAFLGLPPAYAPHQLLDDPRFPESLNASAKALLETFRAMPRRVRHVADLQRWIMSQAVAALHYESRIDSARPPVTAQNVARLLAPHGVASKNTITAYLLELQRYNFVAPVQTADRRQRAVTGTKDSEQLFAHYLFIHLRALDAIDGGARRGGGQDAGFCRSGATALCPAPTGGGRLDSSTRKHRRFRQDGFGQQCPACAALPNSRADGRRCGAGLDRPGLAERNRHPYADVAHPCRAAVRAYQTKGLIGWAQPSNRGDCWLSPELIRAYRRWQAEKFSALSQAAREALEHSR